MVRSPGHAVGKAAIGAGDHDGVKGHVLRPEMEHQILQPCSDLLLRNAGPDLLQDLLQRLFGDPLGRHHGVQLLVILHSPQLPQKLCGRHQIAGQRFAVALMLQHRHIRLFIAQPTHLLLAQRLAQQHAVSPARAHFPDLRSLDTAARRLDIAGVGKVIRLLAGDQGHAVRSGGVEAGGIEAVGLAGEQHGIQAVAVQQGSDLMKMIHGTILVL